MDALLARLGYQAVNVALRSGISITSALAIQQCSRLLKTIDGTALHLELETLQSLLSSKIKILSPAIELIELKSGRGNVILESAVPLVKSLQKDIVTLGQHLEDALASEELLKRNGVQTRSSEKQHAALCLIIREIKDLLARIDREIPLIQLAITASGESLSTSLPPSVSPSRLLQAAMFLTLGDGQFAADTSRRVQIGPVFTVSVYMLFVGHDSRTVDAPVPRNNAQDTPARSAHGKMGSGEQEPADGFVETERKPIWKEVIHKCRLRLCRSPRDWVFDRANGYRATSPPPLDRSRVSEPSRTVEDEIQSYSYHLEMIEDLDDGRMHDQNDANCTPFEKIAMAGIRESLPLHQVSKIFYADTGRILNLGSEEGDNNPVLLLKRDLNSEAPWRLSANPFMSTRLVDGTSQEYDVNEQNEIDCQLRGESNTPADDPLQEPEVWRFPPYLDQEWLAFEVFVEDDHRTDSEEEEQQQHGHGRHRSSVDSGLMAQIGKMTLGSSPSMPTHLRPSLREIDARPSAFHSFVASSPFGAVASSLSLLEMLIRLTSLQEFQQASHLSIPDHILTFFLEETSTTGLRGEGRWKARSEAKRKVGFDPYTDTPAR